MQTVFLIAGITAALAAAVPARANLIVNGDFAQNDTVGFTSAYLFSPGNLVPAGRYDTPGSAMDLAGDNPAFVWPGDRTAGGNTRILAVNGATNGISVWSQTVTLEANTLYGFSAWVSSLVATSPATLKFSAAAVQIGNVFTAPANTNNWSQFTGTYFSGAGGAVAFTIVDTNTAANGNDFALDDIALVAIPEPGTLLLSASAVGLLGLSRQARDRSLRKRRG